MAEHSFSRLVAAAHALESEYASVESTDWAGSPFEWLKKIPSSRRRGKAAEVLVERWLTDEGFEVGTTGDSEADILVDGYRVEVKSSTLWVSGTYRFQQIRDQNYDLMICLGLSPSEAHCWVLPKALLLERVIGQGRGQHGGAGAAETAWLTVDPKSPEAWLRPRDGNLDEAVELIRQSTA